MITAAALAVLLLAGVQEPIPAPHPDKPATEKEAPGPAQQGPDAALSRSGMFLSHARKLQASQGCAAATPAYRVIAAFGEGYEVAQYELGACLLEADGANTIETALFREEALFWLRRAAYAGQARAQHKLATILSGDERLAAEGVAPVPVEAMGWALVYEDNSERDLFALPSVYPETLALMTAALSDEEVEDASRFAAEFGEIKMALFTPPLFQRGDGERRRRGPPGGKRGGGERRR